MNGVLQPCAYTSKKLPETKSKWAVWKKESYTVLWVFLTWWHFLEVWTDHKNLEALKTPRRLSPKQVHWTQYFNQVNFKLYLPGGKNFLADAFSKLPQYNSFKPEIIRPVIPSRQLAAPVITRPQRKLKHQVADYYSAG